MDNLEIDYKTIDGGIFLSENMPGKCLKRWWQSHLEILDHTIDFFQFCNQLLTETKLESNVKIYMIYERGPDWALMDYDSSAVPLDELEENDEIKMILNKLYESCGEIHSKNSVCLIKMIENKSTFLQKSLMTGQLIITGLQVY